MKLSLILFFILSTTILFSQNNDSLRMNASINQDTVFLRTQLHDSLTYIHSNGLIETKSDFIQSLVTQSIVYSKAVFTKYDAVYYDNININIGLVEVEGFFKEQQFKVKLRFSSIYKKSDDGKWMLWYWQSTKVS